MDSILYLKERIWPLIKKEIPDATLSVYGAYASESINLLHDEGEGFLIKGWTENVDVVMEQARICLAPLRFGAGLKGKVLDAMKNGTPCVTTSIGAEGIHGDLKFCGIVADDPQDIAESAVTLYRYKDNWVNAQQNGFDILQSRFQKNTFSDDLILCIKKIHEQISNHRNINFIGRILQHQTMRSTKYLSKWIEEKNS